ncbi:hypothetical protein M2475_001884 [Breznakia sp. PF5-3]|uniref:hypothetical protein n=1 Tax=unclassified Breznakia TaxID=2623764 RepID=UPI002404BC69|nr:MULTISPECIES: hypothetical protein [unclassified Breznakia]MDF9825428.1 hypothetical protein [Breznakia sp. PM6-1]MDF9836306.1 hypothetical protein [Breznakia sp. PF5-3]MDF9838922.1 hypothetical protein [Breznakia sp. PFB2-8]MDF9860948.1 hypothetical protein [Breznakia sp. PH5-24]
MDKNYRKIIIMLICSVVIVSVTLLFNHFTSSRHGKVIRITILDDKQKVIFDEDVETSKSELSELLKELDGNKTIKLKYGGDESGMKIVGLGEDKLINENEAQKLYWQYSSSNNVQCLENKGCGPIEKVLIEDGDEFTFQLQYQEK